MHYHAESVPRVLAHLKTAKTGLAESEAAKRLSETGPNELSRAGEKTGRWRIFLHQWKSPLIIILLIAGAISGLLGETLDTTIIIITAAVNALIGFIQEDKASRALSKLQSMVEYQAIVIRDGEKKRIASRELVHGDIIILAAGDKIQADARVMAANDFFVNESALTGESDAVKKQIAAVAEKSALGDRKCMVYRGTVVMSGDALAIVTAAGNKTEIGQIAALVRDTKDDETPLQIQLARLSRHIALIIIVIAAGIIILGLFAGSGRYSFIALFQTAVAVAVAAIPEGLVISLTVILAIGMQYMVARRALVRKLVAAETLGSVSVICTDKTGTITVGQMRVTAFVGRAHDFLRHELEEMCAVPERQDPDAALALKIGALASDASIQNASDHHDSWILLGEATEAALVHAAAMCGFKKDELDRALPRVATLTFSSHRKFMATVHDVAGRRVAYIKGAPEALLHRADKIMDHGEVRHLTEADREWFGKRIDELTDQGLRVIGIGYKELADHDKKIHDDSVRQIVFVGIMALADPVRDDVAETLATARKAGIHVVMITGDHSGTAQAIARSIGLPHAADDVLTGDKLEMMSDAELGQAVKKISIFARVDPEHKIRLVHAFQANGEVVAMTGDGVNDAPAIKAADIGVALGSGTDVAKETSDMVLLNDSFSTIVAAVEEGRRIYQNVKKVTLYLFAGSFTEVALIVGSIIFGLPLPLLPAQILWMNIVEETLPTMALAFDRGDEENMTDPPRPKNTSIFDRQMKLIIVLLITISNALLFGLFIYFWQTTGDIVLVRTLMFVGVGIDAFMYIYSLRSFRRPLWRMNPFSNHALTSAVGLGWILLIGAVYFPPFQTLLRTKAIGIREWGIMIAFGLLSVIIFEGVKWAFVRKNTV